MTFEEINGVKLSFITGTSMTYYNKNNKLEYNNKKLQIKLYKDIPIIPHDSEKPKISFEEIGTGKYYSKIKTTETDYNISYNKEKSKSYSENKKLCKRNVQIKQYENIPIIPHQSEKPTISYEEINGGKNYAIIKTSITNYNNKNKSENTKNFHIKQYKDIPIILHESEKPNISSEEIDGGKLLTMIKTSNTNYKIIPIIAHDAEKPSKIFEECCSMEKYNNIINKNNNMDETNTDNGKENELKYEQIKNVIIVHESPKPSLVFEEIRSGKLYSNYLTSKFANDSKKNIKKFKEIPIIPHDSEKPSIIFEEANTGISITLKNRYI